ncbi:MAG: ROK family protein, partial [Ktedonobacteraceae bacterium]
IAFTFRGEAIELSCECGRVSHINAYCSGRGIAALLPLVAEHHLHDYGASALFILSSGNPCRLTFEHFVAAVCANDPFARTILDAVTLPLAMMFLHVFTIDAEIERIVLTGGIINSLGNHYRTSLLQHLDTLGLYQVTTQDADFFHRSICLGIPDDNAGLIGAALAVPFTKAI